MLEGNSLGRRVRTAVRGAAESGFIHNRIRVAQPATAPETATQTKHGKGLLAPFLLACLALALYLFRLGVPPVYIYDEATMRTRGRSTRKDAWMSGWGTLHRSARE